MINELLTKHHLLACPVCGRLIYDAPLGYWCPFCGVDIKSGEALKLVNLTNERLTNRDENGTPYYCGKYTFNSRAYSRDLKNLSAIDEILEKLCHYEEVEENGKE